MVNALDAVVSGKIGVNRATLEVGVPHTTLKDRASGRVLHGTNVGPKFIYVIKKRKNWLNF